MKEEIVRDRDKIIIETKEFQGKRYLDIRSHYLDNKDQSYMPSKKGITISDVGDIEFLTQALTRNKDEIVKFLLKKREVKK